MPNLVSEDQIRQIVEIFLSTPYGDGRHARRVQKVKLLEEEERSRAAPTAPVTPDLQPMPGQFPQVPS